MSSVKSVKHINVQIIVFLSSFVIRDKTQHMKRSHDGCDNCIGLVRNLQARNRVLSEQIQQLEQTIQQVSIERDEWKHKYNNYLQDSGMQYV